MPHPGTIQCRILKMTREGSSFRKFRIEETVGKTTKPGEVTAYGEMGGRVFCCIGKEVQLAVRFDFREYKDSGFWDAVVDGVFDAAGVAPPSIPAEERSGPPAGKEAPPMPDFRPPSVRNDQPATYGQPAEDQGDIPF